jgi:RNA polymerase sigma factor (sigma-70 family)
MNLDELLTVHRETLVRYFRKHGAYLRRYEASEDLAQGVHLHAVRHQDRFDYQGEPQFVSWLLHLARQHLADRIAHWKALKRDAGPMMRISFSGTGVEPAGSLTGPITYASRKEQLRLATLAMDGLPPRDREIVALMTDGAGVGTVAERLGVSNAAAQRARLRAMDRFRKIYAIVERKHFGT